LNSNLIDIIAYIVIPIIGSVFFVYILIDGINKLGCNVNIGRTLKYGILVIYAVLLLGLSLFQNTFINLFTCVILLPIIAHFICNNKRIYMVYFLGLTVSVFMLDFLLSALFQILIVYRIAIFTDLRYYVILYVLTSKLLSYILVKLYVSLITKKQHSEISKKQYLASFILPLFSIIYIYSLLYSMQFVIDYNLIGLFIVNVIIILFLNIYFSKIAEITEKNYELKNQLILYDQQEKLQFQYYEDVEKKYQESVRVLHDIRKHIQALESLYESTNNEKALEYAKDVHLMLNNLGHKYYTSSKILNIILNDKASIMNSLKINYNIRVGDIDLNKFKDIDLTVIFGNILDNSIEAAKLVNDASIFLIVDVVQNFISISLSNSIKVLPKKHIEGFISTKPNHQGVGLNNVERTVKKYNGDIQYKYDEHMFNVYIMLPI